MKRLLSFFLLCAALLSIGTAMAQAPQRVSYQAVVRHANNRLAANETMEVRLSILKGSADGTTVYVETRQVTTNANGLFTLIIGNGDNLSRIDFSDIDWTDGPYFLKSEVDAEGDQTFSAVSINQVLSVPYALHANSASILVGLTDSLGNVRAEMDNKMQIGRTHTENAINAIIAKQQADSAALEATIVNEILSVRTDVDNMMQIGRSHTENAVNAIIAKQQADSAALEATIANEILSVRTVINDTVLYLTERMDDNMTTINASIAAIDAKVDSINGAINTTITETNDAMNVKVDSIDNAINTTITDATTAINATIAANAAKVDSIDAAINAT
ncbi:MAG: hypothetical protein IJ620_04970, partial [Bacteroidales bacterium]|nr:hypothetical protein [Bacteroidales bacterium]